jgi:hypothetical protein
VETSVRAEDVRSLRLQWGLSCSHDDCPSCAALDRALMRLTGDLKTPEAIRRMAEGTNAMRDPVLGKAIAETPYIDGASHRAIATAYDTMSGSAEKAEVCQVCKQPMAAHVGTPAPGAIIWCPENGKGEL